MATISRASSSFMRTASRASSSRSPLVRRFATPADSTEANAPTFGLRVDRKTEGAEIRRYVGKGMPFLNSTRHRVSVHHPHLWKGKPFKELTIPLRRKGGRDHTGRIAVRHIGGGAKQRLRTVDFHRYLPGIQDVVRIEYDPGRSAHIALLRRRDYAADVSVEEGAALAEADTQGLIPPKDVPMPPEAHEYFKSGWSYILAPEGLRAGDTVRSFRTGIPTGLVEGWGVAEEGVDVDAGDGSLASSISPRALGLMRTVTLKPGNVLPLYLIPPGTPIHNISFDSTGKMRAVRSAGASASVVAHHGPKGEAIGGTEILNMGGQYENGLLTKAHGHVLIKMTSGEVRKFAPGAVATIGTVSNKEHQQRNLGKAGRARWLGIRPTVRGAAMNACDHPHGGGKGKTKGGKSSHSIWGKLTRGVRTRRSKDRDGNKAVVTERPRGPHSRQKK